MKVKWILFLSMIVLHEFSNANSIDSIEIVNFSASELFEKGNKAFKDNRFEESILLYNAILEKQKVSAAVYYNLGNAYFKMNDIPNAILNYEKSLKIDPNDDDAKKNLELVNLKTIDKVESKPELPITNWWRSLLNTNEIDEWAIKSIYLSFLALALLLLYLFFKGIAKRIFFFSGLFAILLSVVFYLMGSYQRSLHLHGTEAIIFSTNVTVKGSPEDDGTRLFVIHEGTKVKIIKNLDDWTEISLMNGNKGWVKTEVYKVI